MNASDHNPPPEMPPEAPRAAPLPDAADALNARAAQAAPPTGMRGDAASLPGVDGAGVGGDPAEARRVIAVSRSLAERLADGLAGRCLPDARIEAVPSFLSALGEAGRDQVAAVIVPASMMAGMVAAGARTLRRMAPKARLLVVADEAGQGEAERAVEHGFDAIVPEPIEFEALHVAWHGRPADAADARPTPDADGDGDGRLAPPERPDISGQVRSLSQRGDAVDPPDDPRALTDDAELGDVDLVEAILNGRGLLRRLALRLVVSRSGLANVAWSAPGEQPPADHVAAPVTCRRQGFGTLHAPPPIDKDQLDAWAGWLARWLALERQVHQLEELSMKDELTGVWNRRYFNRFLTHLLDRATRDRSHVTLLVFDIDDFKTYNDRYGHPAGDEILREIARLMVSSVREHDVVARIGGDEFAVIFWDAEQKRRPDSHHPDSVRAAARRFQQAVCQHRFPKLLNEAPGTLSTSAGLASFPWDGRTPDELLEKADEMAMRSKRQGKNAITFGPGVQEHCPPQ